MDEDRKLFIRDFFMCLLVFAIVIAALAGLASLLLVAGSHGYGLEAVISVFTLCLIAYAYACASDMRNARIRDRNKIKSTD